MEYLIVFMIGFTIGAVVFRQIAIMVTAFVFGGLALYYFVKYTTLLG
jgi:hypothetical protein